MEVTMQKLEKYIDEKLTAALDQVIKFTTTLVLNAVSLAQTRNVQSITYNTAKKLWKKRVQIVPLCNSMEIMVSDLANELREDINQLLRRNTTTPTSQETATASNTT